ncbi:uncharacterized protein N7479_006023 [Penicillium vulpinum]|uniref:uncharacterized protein n=1 Tax=Penicillium vulpinum TaxID=29845 RepID=UPI002546F3B0|nr:uncharacterized protein N7479_006023 [Penicillium vulpinum]KAJ5958873.1 hypothetical protein N7479_006023 [Penicillium vulpinum]
MDSPEYFISWGSEKYIPIRRFEDLQPDRHDLLRSYEEAIETGQTFTQYFSNQPLESYEMDRSLRKNMGCDPSPLDENANTISVCWLDIVRQGDLQQQGDGCYHCSIQGKVFVFDQQLHDRVEFCRSHALQISHSGPSYEDVEREVETTMGIWTDISKQITDSLKFMKGLKKLQLAVKIRLNELQSLPGHTIISPTPTSPAHYLTLYEPDTAVPVERLRQASPAQSESSGDSSSNSDSSESENASDNDEALENEGPENKGSAEETLAGEALEDKGSEDKVAEDEALAGKAPAGKASAGKAPVGRAPDDKTPEEKAPGDKISADKGAADKRPEGKGTGDNSSKQDTRQQRNHNSNNGRNLAPDDDMVIPLKPLSSRTSTSTPLIPEDENGISTDHASLPQDTGKAVSVNPAPSKGSSSISSSKEKQNSVPMDSASSQQNPPVDTHLSVLQSPIRNKHNILIESEGPSFRAVKRRKLAMNIPKVQKEPPIGRKSKFQERVIAAAWMRANLHEGWTHEIFETEYFLKFGYSRAYQTLKKWMNGENSQAESHVVVLKVPAPCSHEAVSSDNSS